MQAPFVYMHQEQVQKMYSSFLAGQHDLVPAVAFGFDEGDVFHVYTAPPKTQFAGYSCKSAIEFVANMPQGQDGFEVAAQVQNTLFGNEAHHSTYQTVVVLFAIEANVLQHRVFISNTDGEIQEGMVKFIPPRSELYSRSQGLLETPVLESSKVGIVGLGSGGSAIAVELAKAGVGHLVLIDFDRLELANIARHVCGTGDLGRYKTKAVRDLLYGKNPYIQVQTAELDINHHLEQTALLLKDCHLIIAATDNNRSRFNLNSIALQYRILSIFGRALTRAVGGDVLRVRPYAGPCLGCVFTQAFLETYPEERTQFDTVRSEAPAYVSDDEVKATIQVGLSSDILPISNMVVKLALVELSRGRASGITSLEEDFVADFYIWANRRDQNYASWDKLKYGSRTPTILRWYGAKWERNPLCLVCGESESLDDDDNIFGD